MSEFLDILRKENCDVDNTMERCLDDEEFFLSCLKESLQDENFEKLGEEIQKGNASVAFEYAHSLKGLIGNMGITPLYDKIVGIVEPLRAGSVEGLEEKYKKMIEEKNKFAEIVRGY